MRFRWMLCSLFLLIIALPCCAQIVNCDPSGTWFGGSDKHTPYIMTFSPIAEGRYSAFGQQAIETSLTGYTNITHWTGEIRLNGETGKYQWVGMSFWTWPQELPAAAKEFADALGITIDPTLPELDYARGQMRFLDCNTYQISYDVIGAFENFDITAGRTPFVTTPDINFLALYGVSEIVETYHRMPTTCTLSCYLPLSNSPLRPETRLGLRRR